MKRKLSLVLNCCSPVRGLGSCSFLVKLFPEGKNNRSNVGGVFSGFSRVFDCYLN